MREPRDSFEKHYSRSCPTLSRVTLDTRERVYPERRGCRYLVRFGRQIQLDAGRFVQHEVKNGILGALADLDGFLDGNFEAGEQRRLREEEAFKTLALSPLGVARRLGADASVYPPASQHTAVRIRPFGVWEVIGDESVRGP